MRASTCFALCAALSACAAGAARAQSQAAVAVSVDPCVPVDHHKLRELLAIELGTATAAAAGPAKPAATSVHVSCGAQGIELRLEDAITRKSMARLLPASSFMDTSSTRLLALAIAEFVVASWIELRLQPEPAVEPVGPPPDPAARQMAEQAIEQRTPELPLTKLDPSLSAAATLQLWSADQSVLIGGGLRMTLPLLPTLAWMVAADFATANVGVPFGNIDVLTASAALALAVHLQVSRVVAIYAGPGARLGIARMTGKPADPESTFGDDFTAGFGGPLLLGRVELRASQRVRLAFELETGLATLPVRATLGDRLRLDERELLALAGVWVTSALSIGVAF